MTLSITAVTGSAAEIQTCNQLHSLLTRYDLSAWEFTEKIRVERGTIPIATPS